MMDKLGDKTGDKRKTRPERQTQHPSQGGHIKKAEKRFEEKWQGATNALQT